MKIGILSDSHKKVSHAKNVIDALLERGAEFLIHAGDVVEVETLEYLHSRGVRYVAVYGNNDAHLISYQDKYNLVREPHYFKLAKTTFKLMHLPYYMSGDTEVVIFGHTHEFFTEQRGKTLFINPGEVCGRKKPYTESALLEVQEEHFKLHYITCSDEAVPNSKEFHFSRGNNDD